MNNTLLKIFLLIISSIIMISCNDSGDSEAEATEDIEWNVLEEAFEIVNISTVPTHPELPISTYKSADDPNIAGNNEVSAQVWQTYVPQLPYIKNTTRNLQFNESSFIASPGATNGTTLYVLTSDGYTWAYMSMAINALWPYDSEDYTGSSAINAYYAGNLEVTPLPGTVKITANYKGQYMKFWASTQDAQGNTVALERYFVEDQWGNTYIMHASGELDQALVRQAFDNAVLPAGWTKSVRTLSEDLILYPAEGADDSFHYLVWRDSADNTYHQITWSDQGSLMAQIEGMPIWGGQDDNILTGDAGGAWDDLLHGAGGDDTLIPGQGADEIWGDAGYDTVILAGNQADYALVSYQSGLEKLVLFRDPDIKTMYYCETLQFDDGSITVNDFLGFTATTF